VNVWKLVGTPEFCKLIEVTEEIKQCLSVFVYVVQNEVKTNCLLCEGIDLVCD